MPATGWAPDGPWLCDATPSSLLSWHLPSVPELGHGVTQFRFSSGRSLQWAEGECSANLAKPARSALNLPQLQPVCVALGQWHVPAQDKLFKAYLLFIWDIKAGNIKFCIIASWVESLINVFLEFGCVWQSVLLFVILREKELVHRHTEDMKYCCYGLSQLKLEQIMFISQK